MIPPELMNWTVFHFLCPNFASMIHMFLVFGKKGDHALVATKNKMVYEIKADHLNILLEKDAKTFACGSNHSPLVLTEDGQVYLIRYGLLNRPIIIPLFMLTGEVFNMACGPSHFMVLTNNGFIFVWGEIKYADNGLREKTFYTHMPEILSLQTRNIVHISCGNDFSVVVTDNGVVYACGKNDVGQLGIGTYQYQCIPREVFDLSTVMIEKAVCGDSHTLALSAKGYLYVWGSNTYGQLGIDSETENVFKPEKLRMPIMGRVFDMAASPRSHISAAIGESNRIFIWGQCLSMNIAYPALTILRCLDDAFAYHAIERFTPQPSILKDEEDTNGMNSISKAFDDATTSDLIIQVHGEPIHVHKSVLKIRSQYFRTMFQEHWSESRKSVIEHNQYSYNVYKIFLKYLYTNEIELEATKDALELLDLSEACFESLLKSRCVQKIKNMITVGNVMLFYSASIRYKAEELEEYCFKIAIYYMTEVEKTASFATLDENLKNTFLSKANKAGAFEG